MAYTGGRQLGMLVKSGHEWRLAGHGEAEAVTISKQACIDVVANGHADMVMCRIGPEHESTLVMVYANDSIARIRELLGGQTL